MTSLATNLKDAAGQHPNRPAIRLDESVLTYAELDEPHGPGGRLAAARGIEPGDRVGLMLPNVLGFPIVYYGVLRAGATVVPMNPLLKAREIEHYVADSGAKVVFAWPAAAEQVQAGAAGGRADACRSRTRPWPNWRGGRSRRNSARARATTTPRSSSTRPARRARPREPNSPTPTFGPMRAIVGDRPARSGPDDDVVMGCLPLFHAFGQTLRTQRGRRWPARASR